MKLAPIILKLRTAETSFGNYIGGSADLANAMKYTLQKEAAFVVQLAETATSNDYDNSINQVISERFAVIVGLDNGTSDKEKLGLIAYDKLYNIRAELFRAILGWQIPDTESIVSYSSGKVVIVNRAWLWYQFEFTADTRITDADGVDNGADDLPLFDTIYAQYKLSPSADLPAGGVPVTAFDVDMTQIIDFTTNPEVEGPYTKGFGQSFDIIK